MAPEETAPVPLDLADSAPAAALRHDRLRLPDKFQQVRNDMLNNRPPRVCRDLAASLKVDKMTVWRWRRRIFRAMEATMPWPVLASDKTDGEAALEPSPPFATKRLRESRKGSRQWVAHRHDPVTYPAPDRPRWVDVDRNGEPLPRPLWTYQHIVLLSLDPARRCRTRVVPAGPPTAAESSGKDDLRHRLEQQEEPLVDHGRWRSCSGGLVPLVADMPDVAGGPVIDAWPRKGATGGPAALSTSATIFAAAAGVADPREPSSDRLDICFEQFLRQFRGPAAAYLGGYAAWFAARHDHARRDLQGLQPDMTRDP